MIFQNLHLRIILIILIYHFYPIYTHILATTVHTFRLINSYIAICYNTYITIIINNARIIIRPLVIAFQNNSVQCITMNS